MNPEIEQLKKEVAELKRELKTLTRLITVRADVVQINGILSVKGDVEFKGVRILVGTGSPHTSLAAPNGSIFLRTDGGSATSFYTNYSGSTNWNDY